MQGLRGFIIRRLIQSVITLFILMSVLFFMFRVLPGDPTTSFVDAALPVEAQQAVLEQFGLDKPLMEQYWIYMKNLVQGEFGISFNSREPVVNVIADKLWNTIFLMGFTIGLALIFGILLGALVAWYRGTKFEAVTVSIALFFRSAPVFWIGMVALALFSYKAGWFPTGGMHEPGQQFSGFVDKYINFEFLHHLILPSLVGAAYYIASPMLIMRNSMIEVMEEDFIEMSRAKGLRERSVLFKHAMRNALLPVVTEITLLIGFAIGGQVLVETVFNWPGLGREIVHAIQMNDYPVAQASFFLMGVLVVFLNLVADVLYAYLDPRVTYK
ncbi:peptide/nickel transport system permease protein [Caldalkalibacillus uzonensis]|uniref:Peptide/nickel transport system permease protein n=1 Tax=Caldalkalibacillus uzonensis TaxID=353224 RepID=A0ABU0CSX1_9BACI|nr:ABC transporter permease [Caldalkalibacillus uzonensis]MDQ0338132.1 peptide/nickel transport system permease protein [Caldalkalibacillus uzonensis]